MKDNPDDLVIGVVGPCTAGKTTLIENLKHHGITARHIAQEHSYVPDMWRRITNPDILVFLDVSFLASKKRNNLDWTRDDYLEQHRRLSHARQNANLYLYTDDLTPEQVVDEVISHIAAISPLD
jgi:hypothetical protein